MSRTVTWPRGARWALVGVATGALARAPAANLLGPGAKVLERRGHDLPPR